MAPLHALDCEVIGFVTRFGTCDSTIWEIPFIQSWRDRENICQTLAAGGKSGDWEMGRVVGGGLYGAYDESMEAPTARMCDINEWCL